MNVQSARSASLASGLAIAGLGILVALISDLAMSSMTLPKLVFVLGGFAMLIPTIVVKDPQAYWLFLLVFTFPFDITKWLSSSEASQQIVDAYGMPGSGTVSLVVFVSDVVLAAMVLPWLARVYMRKQTFYFPSFGYIFFFYLAWSMVAALINATSFSLSVFELFRQLLYFLTFLFLINNVSTPLRLRAVLWALFLGFIISAGSVIVWFERGIGTDTVAFTSLHDQGPDNTSGQSQKPGKKNSGIGVLTVGDVERTFGNKEVGGNVIKRSQGIFSHPAIPASLCSMLLQVVFAYLISTKNNWYRLFFSLIYIGGVAALILTFSRAGAIGYLVGTVFFFAVASWSGMITRKIMGYISAALILAGIVCVPLLLVYFSARPESFYMRFNMFEAALQGYAQHPFLGTGLNNSTAAMKSGRQGLLELGIQIPDAEAADSYYLSTLVEVGPIGMAILLFFFGKILMIAMRTMKNAAPDMKPLLVGMVAGLGALATQSLADEPVAGHSVAFVAWLFAALIIVIARSGKGETSPAIAALRPQARFSRLGADAL